jgi:hypothetical protein
MGTFMMTNPTLFSSIVEPGFGFKMPETPYDVGDNLRASAGLPDEEDELSLSGEKMEYDSTKEMLIDVLSERM